MMTPDEIRQAFDMTKFPFIDQYMKGYSAFEVHVGQDNMFGPDYKYTVIKHHVVHKTEEEKERILRSLIE